jgi:hypothetical protein
MLLLAEELLLLALHDEKGKIVSSAATAINYGLSGALLMELAIQGKLGYDRKHIYIHDSSSVGEPLLDEVLEKIGQSKKVRSPQYWVSRLCNIKGLKQRLLNGLVEKRILAKEEHRVLGIFTRARYFVNQSSHEQEVRHRIRNIILNGVEPSERSAILIGLMHACNLTSEVFSREERKRAGKRIKEIARKEVMGKVVSDIVAGVDAAIMAAVTASVVSSNSSSDSSST